MPSDYTDILGLELQETGENLNVWGERLNRALRLIDDAQAFEVIPLTGNLTLSNTMNVENQARKVALAFTDAGLSAVPTVTIPPVKRLRYIENRGATYAVTITAGGIAGSVPPGRKVLVLCNGTDVSVFDPVAEVAQLAAAAATSATQAQTAATNAGTAASTAAGHASAASTARTGAQTAQAAAEAALDAFDDRYLGAKSSAPTLDNDSNTLIVGAIYFDTTLGMMRVWSGSAWQAFIPAAADYLLKSGGTMTGPIGLVSGQYASQAEAQAGTDTSKLMTPQRTAQAIASLVPLPKFESALLHVREEQPSGTSGPSFATGGVLETRNLNVVKVNQIAGASLASNILTLPAGTYVVIGWTIIAVGVAQNRLVNTTDNQVVVVGGSARGPTSSNILAPISGRFVLSGTKSVVLRTYINSSGTYGSAASSGEAEVYSDLMIWKVA